MNGEQMNTNSDALSISISSYSFKRSSLYSTERTSVPVKKSSKCSIVGCLVAGSLYFIIFWVAPGLYGAFSSGPESGLFGGFLMVVLVHMCLFLLGAFGALITALGG